jgi:D-beta-D-heptose 7-phosphate kinase / D-beta-D-heptose 1-phosphate adenosyltransferase
MCEEAQAVLENFPHRRALVIGDAMLDTYLSGPSTRLCQEAPVPVVDVTERAGLPGGAGNCAHNLAALGIETQLLGVVGRDCEAELLRSALDSAGVDAWNLLEAPRRRTLSKSRVICDGHLLTRYDQGTTTPIDAELEQAFLERLASAYAAVDLVIVSDYGYGVLTPGVIERLAELQQQSPRTLVVDAKNLPAYRRVGMTLCKPNYRETLRLLGLNGTLPRARRWEQFMQHGERVLEATGSRIAAVTLDCEGALVFERGATPYRTFARTAPTRHTAGAGDTFLSTFAAAIAAGAGTPTAAEMASAAASVVVSKPHTAACTAVELKQRIAGEPWARWDLASLLPILAEHRRQNRQIVLTNGCFDLLHRGHITYLEQAKRLGDVLVVGVNTDESIRRLKGSTRPINGLADRMGVLSAISSVDHVVPFGEDTPHRLIEAIRPDVFVKGGDYTRATLPEADLVERLGGTVKILPFVSDRSTTGIISRIRDAYSPPDSGRTQEGVEHAKGVVDDCPPAAVR